MSFTRERIDEIIDSLQGSAVPLADILEEGEDEDDRDLTDAIDQAIFLCPQCGWWDERGHGHESDLGEDICNDCHRSNGEEDDE